MRKIWDWIVSIPQDKLLHAYAGTLVTLYSLAAALLVFGILSLLGIYRVVFPVYWWVLAFANIVAVCALIIKELYDAEHPDGHSVETGDIIFGLGGILLADIPLAVIGFFFA